MKIIYMQAYDITAKVGVSKESRKIVFAGDAAEAASVFEIALKKEASYETDINIVLLKGLGEAITGAEEWYNFNEEDLHDSTLRKCIWDWQNERVEFLERIEKLETVLKIYALDGNWSSEAIGRAGDSLELGDLVVWCYDGDGTTLAKDILEDKDDQKD